MRTKQTVEQILKHNPNTRDSDIELILQVWFNEGVILMPSQIEMIKRCSPPESIRRYRQMFRKKYPASPEVEAARKKEELKWREAKGVPREGKV